MNSKKRTQILYDDPNSMFKANKTIYLHELQGSTLKTRKPTLIDINDGLKSSELMSKVMSKLSNLDSIMEFFTGPLQFGIQPTFIKDASMIITSILPIIKQLMKSKRTSFNEDDVFSIKTMLDDIVDKRDAIITRQYGPGLNNLFAKFINNLNTMFQAFGQLLPYMDITGKIQSMDVIPIENPQAEEDFQDAVEGPPDYPDEIENPDDFIENDDEPPPLIPDYVGLEPGPPPPIIWGRGRYRVLSNRMSKIQQHPFKRFL